ncbi:helix-turn-helix transcriptional regulator [Desulfosporosinus nitroreducens]|uniref:Helix-turn-helix transcriptional regulator n=1 Tax=Desulfosporosinus nitroreducens TaxID=2018668 RepID=A0ABT8QY55_9FIRM|nr:helix-turn-helix transcriptional regulator [Desulfosporosinus nitroreducens]MDO0826090.1 helix-turn-helix transcriptional regulator [Desulfosporosinus nitroreducens]
MKNNIKELRKLKSIRQEDLAILVDVTRQTINAIENNKYDPTLALSMKLAKIFNKHVDEIFTLDI